MIFKQKTIRSGLALITLATIVISCNPTPEEISEPSDILEIRIENLSEVDFKNVLVIPTTEEFNYGDIRAGETTSYHQFSEAYSYAYVELEIDTTTYFIQPIDFVGESMLANGKYTYQLSSTDSEEQYGRLSIKLRVD